MDSKTYVAALGTSLLAKATDDRIDPLSIKATYSDRTFSLRTLGHAVLVPSARVHGFSLRVTGREPLNNQPFFRYDHMMDITRVRNGRQHADFITGLQAADDLSAAQALAALAAYLRIAIQQADIYDSAEVPPGRLGLSALVAATRSFVVESRPERPKRLQAIAAAALDLGHSDVRSRKINDPSRDYPGDVQAYASGLPYLAVEVRGKAVPLTEAEAFVEACARAGISRVVLFVDWTAHRHIETAEIESKAVRQEDVLLTIFESVEHLLLEAIAWSDAPVFDATKLFAEAAIVRLREIEVPVSTLAEWSDLLVNAQTAE